MGFYDNLPGYKNPLEDKTPSWGGDYDWKGAGGGIDWDKAKFGVAEDGDSKWGGVFSNLFDKTKNTEKYRSEAKRPYGGDWSRGLGGQILENLGVYEPQKMSPLVIPAEERQSPWGAVGRIAGTIGGALIGGPAGAALGGTIGGTAGSFF
jgi:hypothetical protein